MSSSRSSRATAGQHIVCMRSLIRRNVLCVRKRSHPLKRKSLMSNSEIHTIVSFVEDEVMSLQDLIQGHLDSTKWESISECQVWFDILIKLGYQELVDEWKKYWIHEPTQNCLGVPRV